MATRFTPQNVNKVTLQNNLFYGNGASDTNQTNATNNLGNGFSPALLGTTAAAAQGNQGNFVGNPAFVFPIDPRPGSDGPANFYIDADFELTSVSAAIDNAWEARPSPTDFLGNSQVYINGGLVSPATAHATSVPSSINGTGGQAIGGSFRVVTTSLVPDRRCNVRRRRDRQRSRRRRRRSPSPSRAMSIRRTSRRPTWSSRVGHQLVFSRSRHQPDLDRRPHGRIQSGGPVHLVGNRRPLDRSQRDPEHDGSSQCSATPIVPS